MGHLFFIVLYGQPDKAAEKTPGDPVGKNPDDNATAALRFGVVQSEKGRSKGRNPTWVVQPRS